MRVIEGFLRSGQSPPPDPETARIVPHPKEPIEYDPIHTIVSACQKTGVGLAEGIHALSKITLPYWLPEGPFLPSASLGRSLCYYWCYRTLLLVLPNVVDYRVWISGQNAMDRILAEPNQS